MSNIEPTEEQMQAAYELCKQSTFVYANDGVVFRAMLNVSDVARLLAEREAKLREGYDASVAYYKAQADAYHLDVKTLHMHLDTARARERTFKADLDNALAINDELRARVAELEAKAANLDARLWDRCEDLARVGLERVHADAVHSKRETQHLARIAELEAKANEACRWCAEEDYCDCLGCGGRLPVVCVVGGKCARCGGAEAGALRARIKELEAVVAYQRTTHEADLRGLAEREAQHLADIKALLNLLKESRQFLWLMNTSGPLVELRAIVNEHIARLAHYDDAKAAETIVDRLTKEET